MKTKGGFIKRLAFILAIATIASSAAYSIDLGLAAGGGLRAESRNWVSEIEDFWDNDTFTNTYGFLIPEIFFDATYFEAALGYAFMLGGSTSHDYNGDTVSFDPIMNRYSYLIFSLLGKYPFDVAGPKVFPIFGIEFHLNTLYVDMNGTNLKVGMTDEEKSHLNLLWVNLGIGADFKLSNKLFIRPKLILGFAFLDELERDALEIWELDDYSASIVKFKIDLGVYLGYELKAGKPVLKKPKQQDIPGQGKIR